MISFRQSCPEEGLTLLIDKRMLLREAEARAAGRRKQVLEETEMVKKSEKSSEAELKAVMPKGKATPAKKAGTVKKASSVRGSAGESAEKSAGKKTTTKKTVTAGKPSAKKAVKYTVLIEYQGRQISAEDAMQAAVKAYEAEHKDVELKTVELYIKPEENAAYYVVNGDASPEYRIAL